VLLGALIAAEKLIIQPIENHGGDGKTVRPGRMVGTRGAQPVAGRIRAAGPRVQRDGGQLGERERELIASNDRLTVMASIDMLSGLANRRGFQSRLDFEWMKAQQYNSELSLLMIDVDHFKLFNDTYGHPEGDACLSRLGETLAGIAADPWALPDAMAARNSACCCRTPTFAGRWRSARWCARRCKISRCPTHLQPSNRHRQRRRGRHQAQRRAAAGRPDRGRRRRLYAAKHRGRNAVAEHGFVRIADGERR
jgi:hypothetical protein